MKTKLINERILHDYGASLLRARGIEDVEEFLNPTEKNLQSWKDLDNIEKGVQLIADLAPDAKVALITDSDVDGYTSAAILYQYLKQLLPELKIDVYIHEGKAHGLEEHWELIADGNYYLVIVPDAGTNDAEYAAQIPSKILVIDHHLADIAPAPNMTVINNQESINYANKNLSGAGMAYQFCRALDAHFARNDADKYIDLAALGVCADMMSGLEIENQFLWRKGFSIEYMQNYFFMTLARKQAYSITGSVSPTDEEIAEALNPTSVAFYIVPLINAMIRVGTAAEKERLWLAFVDGQRQVPSNKRGAKGTMELVAIESTRECVNARAHQNKFKDEAVARIEQKIFEQNLLDNKILFVCLGEEDTLPSELNGLVATQLVAKYKRPTIIARLNDQGYVRGSIRGLSNCEMGSFKNYLTSLDLCEYVQGHDQAAGISLSEKNIEKLLARANSDLAQYDFNDDFYEVEFERQALDSDLACLIVDLSNYKDIWSQNNREPLIHITDLHFTRDDIQVLGKNSDTLKIEKEGIVYMKFFAKELISQLKTYDNLRIELVGRANLNRWNGFITPQIFIEAIQIDEDKLTDF